ncbi:MAG TPA: hypothetical protein VM864_12625 [Pyrinomonadaceae bacterium]|jgi:hypothetical protein|nr:hypothetical protein [Pyrinomonadaceae bacterium]
MGDSHADGNVQPPIPAGFGLPFYYASLYNCAMYFAVEPRVVAPYLEGKPLRPALFGGKCLVYFNYQLYTAEFPQFISVVGEIELNIVSYPVVAEGRVPTLRAREFILGEDQTKLYGNLRVHVPCDNPNAIKAGVQLFGEPKFQTTFDTSLPSWNDPTARTWKFTCNDPKAKPDPQGGGSKPTIFTAEADLLKLTPEPGNVSPTTEYGILGDRLVGCRWNILEPHDTYFLDARLAKRVAVTYGESKHPMRRDMQTLVGDRPCIAVQTFSSRPAAIQSRAFYADI